ncbi:MAG TPA: serine hydrolase domain-containing protein [Gaiellaceae bacterium]|nr:serine hydrolase domain-containing protein [Gaiellaceae bacterium]
MRGREGRLGALLHRAQAQQRLPGVAAALFRHGELAWSDAVGLADVDAATVATRDTQYRVGSITKTFAAAAVLQLRDEGRLDLDDPVAQYVEELPHRAPTLRSLLSHTSGLQREQPGDMWETMVMPTREELLAGLGASERVLSGSHWHYSNLAFSLLGEVVERTAGVPYREHVAARLLRPLGLERTTWRPEPPVAVPYLVDPYADGVSVEPTLAEGSLDAAGELWSTAPDVARWGAFLADPDPAILSPESAEEMRTVHAMAEPERWLAGWGLGLSLERRGDRVWAGHGGAMPGFLAAFAFRPAERVAAAVLTNSGARAEPDVLVLDLGETELELEPEAPEEWRPAPPPDDVAPLLGRWWSEGEGFTFSWRQGRLEARVDGLADWRPPAVFERVDEDVWRTVSGRERGELLRIRRDENGDVARLNWAGYPFTREPRAFGG